MEKKILVIDDDPDVRAVAMLALELEPSWKVLGASSGPEGIVIATAERPDVILLDVMMPGADGPETLSRLRANSATAEIPVIFLTAKVRDSDRERLKSLGAVAVMAKPFDPMTLGGDIARALHWPTE